MPNYANLGGNSGVRAYEINASGIDVEFKEGKYKHYRYTDHSAGAANILELKRRAQAGVGLNSYISSVVKTGYESKW